MKQKNFGKIYKKPKAICFSDEPFTFYYFSTLSFPLPFINLFKLKNKIKKIKKEIEYNNSIIEYYRDKIDKDYQKVQTIEIEKYSEAVALNTLLKKEMKLLKIELSGLTAWFIGLNND